MKYFIKFSTTPHWFPKPDPVFWGVLRIPDTEEEKKEECSGRTYQYLHQDGSWHESAGLPGQSDFGRKGLWAYTGYYTSQQAAEESLVKYVGEVPFEVKAFGGK